MTTTPETDPSAYYGDKNLTPRPAYMGRWAEPHMTWHRHELIHAHAGGERDHSHIITDLNTAQDLAGLLDRIIAGQPADGDTAVAQTLRDQLLIGD
jgi:hypothetical protein